MAGTLAGAMRFLGRTEHRVVPALVVTAVVPLLTVHAAEDREGDALSALGQRCLQRADLAGRALDVEHSYTQAVSWMKNITLSVDEEVLAAVRRYAAARDCSVNSLVRGFLTELARRGDEARKARKRLRRLSDRSRARIGSKSWDRQQLHER